MGFVWDFSDGTYELQASDITAFNIVNDTLIQVGLSNTTASAIESDVYGTFNLGDDDLSIPGGFLVDAVGFDLSPGFDILGFN